MSIGPFRCSSAPSYCQFPYTNRPAALCPAVFRQLQAGLRAGWGSCPRRPSFSNLRFRARRAPLCAPLAQGRPSCRGYRRQFPATLSPSARWYVLLDRRIAAPPPTSGASSLRFRRESREAYFRLNAALFWHGRRRLCEPAVVAGARRYKRFAHSEHIR